MDIPMAHLENTLIPDSIEIIPHSDFAVNTEKTISPFEAVDDESALFFDENQRRVVPQFKREQNEQIYQPDNTVEFTPDSFSVAAVLKKNLTYDSSKMYNIKICIKEPTENTLTWSKQLITIFGAAGARQLCPANIVINNQSNQPSSLYAEDYTTTDFVFVKTYDGNAMNQEKTSYLDVYTILNSRTNLWLTVQDTAAMFKNATASVTTWYNSPQIYQQRFTLNAPVADSSYEFSYYPKSVYTYHNWATNAPFFILERPNYGFVIISSEQFLNNLNANAKLIYETLFQIYAKTYIKTVFTNSWITDEPIEYMGSPDCKFKQNHKTISLDNMIAKSKFGCKLLPGEYKLQLLDIDSINAVIFSKTDSNNNLLFNKLFKTDPVKEQSQISLYTSKNTVIYYKKTVIKQLESKIQIKSSIEEDPACIDSYICTVTILPIKSSKHKIYTSKEYTFTLEHPERLYYLAATEASQDDTVESTLLLLDEYEYSPASGTAIAVIQVRHSMSPIAADVRQLGGGAPMEKQYDDYDLMDIGSLKGRPYRIGTSMVIKLPKRLEKYDAYIADAIAQRKVAADLAIIKYI